MKKICLILGLTIIFSNSILAMEDNPNGPIKIMGEDAAPIASYKIDNNKITTSMRIKTIR